MPQVKTPALWNDGWYTGYSADQLYADRTIGFGQVMYILHRDQGQWYWFYNATQRNQFSSDANNDLDQDPNLYPIFTAVTAHYRGLPILENMHTAFANEPRYVAASHGGRTRAAYRKALKPATTSKCTATGKKRVVKRAPVKKTTRAVTKSKPVRKPAATRRFRW